MPTSTSIIQQASDQQDPASPQRQDETDAMGHMPGPGADDSVDELVAEMQLYEGDDDEAQEVNLAAQVNEAERSRHFDTD